MSKQQEDEKILEGIGEYKYGFHDRDDNYAFKSGRGLSREVVENISRMKGEPQWMLDFRLKALDHFLKRPMPNWGPDLSGLDLQNIFYYVKPMEKSEKSWEDVPDDIKRTFDKLGVPEAELEKRAQQEAGAAARPSQEKGRQRQEREGSNEKGGHPAPAVVRHRLQKR